MCINTEAGERRASMVSYTARWSRVPAMSRISLQACICSDRCGPRPQYKGAEGECGRDEGGAKWEEGVAVVAENLSSGLKMAGNTENGKVGRQDRDKRPGK